MTTEGIGQNRAKKMTNPMDQPKSHKPNPNFQFFISLVHIFLKLKLASLVILVKIVPNQTQTDRYILL